MIRYESLPENINRLLPRAADMLRDDPRVIFAYLFGGLARDRQAPLSDIDIAVYLAPSADPGDSKFELFNSLSSALGTGEIDLVILNTAPLSLTGRILARRTVLVDKQPVLRHSFESIELRKFFDFNIVEKRHLKRRYGIG